MQPNTQFYVILFPWERGGGGGFMFARGMPIEVTYKFPMETEGGGMKDSHF